MSYLEHDLVVGGGGPSHPESELAGVPLHVLCHTQLGSLRSGGLDETGLETHSQRSHDNVAY
jgi:hypothetical protein